MVNDTRLRTRRQRLEQHISERIVAGQELATRRVRSWDELSAFEKACADWSAGNAALLRESFTTEKPARECEAAGRVGLAIIGAPLSHYVDHAYWVLAQQITCLQTILGRLPMIPRRRVLDLSSARPLARRVLSGTWRFAVAVLTTLVATYLVWRFGWL